MLHSSCYHNIFEAHLFLCVLKFIFFSLTIEHRFHKLLIGKYCSPMTIYNLCTLQVILLFLCLTLWSSYSIVPKNIADLIFSHTTIVPSRTQICFSLLVTNTVSRVCFLMNHINQSVFKRMFLFIFIKYIFVLVYLFRNCHIFFQNK